MDKRALRSEMRKRTSELSPEAKSRKSSAIFGRICRDEAVAGAKVIALYSSLPDEPSTADAVGMLSEGHTVVLPRVDGDDMEFFPYRREELRIGAFGIMEPTGATPVPPQEIDVIIVPGRAFSPDGVRLGRGRGYYDRYLSRKGFRALKIGVCFAEQLVGGIPSEEHDIRMDRIISE